MPPIRIKWIKYELSTFCFSCFDWLFRIFCIHVKNWTYLENKVVFYDWNLSLPASAISFPLLFVDSSSPLRLQTPSASSLRLHRRRHQLFIFISSPLHRIHPPITASSSFLVTFKIFRFSGIFGFFFFCLFGVIAYIIGRCLCSVMGFSFLV